MGILSSRQHFGAAAILLGLSALLSRVIGLVRDKIISWQFGASGEADMYFAAFVVPDIINYLLAGGFMSITIIPLLAQGFEENEDNAWQFFSCVCLWMAIASTVFTFFGFVWAQNLATIVAPGFSDSQLSRLAFFMRIIMPAQIFFLSGSCFTALLLLRRQFAVPALTPLLYNGGIILGGVLLPLLPGCDNNFGMTGYCIGVLVGAFGGAFLLPFFVAIKGGISFRPVLFHPWLKKFLLIALPLMLGQTVVMLDEQFLRVFGSMLEEGSVSLLNYGRRIAQVPVGLMGQAVAVASYPFLVKLLAQNEIEKFNSTLREAMAAALALIIPCALWMISSALPILGIIFEGGRFGFAETLACEPLTRILLASTPFWILYMVLVRAFYAHADTLTPALTGTIVTIACIPCYYALAVPAGAWAISLLSSTSVAVYVMWLVAIWIKRHGCYAFNGLASIALKSMLCSAPASCAAWLTQHIALNKLLPPASIISYAIALCASFMVFSICFILLACLIAPQFLKDFQKLLRLKQS